MINMTSVKKLFLLLCVFYFAGFLSHFVGVFQPASIDMFSQSAQGSKANQIVGIVLFIMALAIFHFSQYSVLDFFKQAFLWLLLILWFALSISWSSVPFISFRRLAAFTIMVFVVYTLVKTFEPQSLLRFFVYAIGIAALIGLLEAVFAPSRAFIDGGIRDGAFTGMYYDKNGGARVYAYALLIGVGLKLYQCRVGLAATVLLTICLLLSRSATAAVMVAAGLTLIFILSVFHTRMANKNALRLSAIILFGALGVFVLYVNYEFILNLLGRDAGLTNRTIIWQLLNDYIEAEYVFGYGFGAFWSSGDVADFIERWSFIGNAHSGYYEAILHGGIVCLALVIALIWYSVFRAFKQYVSPYHTSISVIIITIVLLQAVVNYIGYVIINHNSTDMFVFLLVYFIASRRSLSYTQNESIQNVDGRHSIHQYEA